MQVLSYLLLFLGTVYAGTVPLKDNIHFAFERCKALSADIESGQLKELVVSPFDLHCQKNKDPDGDFNCVFYDPGSNKKLGTEKFSGGSDLGVAELRDKDSRKIKFLIGKSFASFESGKDQKVCIGIYLFEQDALKKKESK